MFIVLFFQRKRAEKRRGTFSILFGLIVAQTELMGKKARDEEKKGFVGFLIITGERSIGGIPPMHRVSNVNFVVPEPTTQRLSELNERRIDTSLHAHAFGQLLIDGRRTTFSR